jgi:threonine dehydrogenase-like Zn-dependent dehydrogenase
VVFSGKEIDLRFVFGYTPLEFRDALYTLADGKLDGSPLITGPFGLDGVATAFEALGDPETHAKILIDLPAPPSHPDPQAASSSLGARRRSGWWR